MVTMVQEKPKAAVRQSQRAPQKNAFLRKECNSCHTVRACDEGMCPRCGEEAFTEINILTGYAANTRRVFW